MQDVDLILTNAHVLTMDEAYRVFADGAVAIRGDRIAEVGFARDIAREYHAKELVDCQGRVLLPGLVNSHTHAPMTLMRGLADDRRLDVWLMGYVMPVEREFVSPDFCRLGTLLACAEMIQSGVTCFADMYYFEDAVAAATAEAGMRGVCGQTVLKFPSPDAESYEDSLAAARDFIARWKGHPLIVPSIAPHTPYTSTVEILRACAALALEFDVPLQIHLAETSQEVDQSRREHDMPVVPWVKKQGLLEAKVLAAHCVHVDEGEIRTLLHARAGVAHNPSSNLKLASGFAPVKPMLDAGLDVGIGTDGTASNNDLDMFEEMRLASFIAKAVGRDPTALPAKQVLTMATRLGARALHMGDEIGSVENGKRADLALVDLSSLHTRPHFDREPDSIYARLVYSAKSSDVWGVLVNGRWLMRERRLLTIDIEPILQAAQDRARHIDAFLIEREESILSKLVAIGSAAQEESYEVQIKLRLRDAGPVLAALESGPFHVLRRSHYQEYDTYFSFLHPIPDRLRYREDEFVGDDGKVFNVRYRLTLMGPAADREFPNSVLLSRSRYIAPATHSLRFYREYFKPATETAINKDRLRWQAQFRGVEFFINLDRLTKPHTEGWFLEVKSRTWSRRDAEEKATLISDLLDALGVSAEAQASLDYPDLAPSESSSR